MVDVSSMTLGIKIPEGWGRGVQTKKPSGGVWIFSGTTHFTLTGPSQIRLLSTIAARV